MRIAPICLLITITLSWVTAASGQPIQGMVKLKLDGKWIEGQPLRWNKQRVDLLGRDGKLWQFNPDRVTEFRKTADRFRPNTTSQLRATLLRELGDGFEVSGTNHYMVAHRAGEGSQWAHRFEKLYGSFMHYFSVRGFKTKQPAFPLLAVVCRDRDDFNRYSAQQGATATGNLAGYYQPTSNRITLYDMREKDGASGDSWQNNAAVIIHEATHQIAFNTGIHDRFSHTPQWVVEGLATMFEAPGVHDSRNHPDRKSRINRGRLDDFRQIAMAAHRWETIRDMVASDQVFSSAPRSAYAEAWALTFYLAETQSGKYAKYLAKTASRPPFSKYTADQRLDDFTSLFGDDWPMLESRMLRFVSAL